MFSENGQNHESLNYLSLTIGLYCVCGPFAQTEKNENTESMTNVNGPPPTFNDRTYPS